MNLYPFEERIGDGKGNLLRGFLNQRPLHGLFK